MRGFVQSSFVIACLAGAPAALFGQSLTAGTVTGAVRARNGEPVPGAAVTIEAPRGAAVRISEAGPDGSFRFHLVPAGTYWMLVEQVGFQPVRFSGILVSGGRTTAVVAEVERKPPPIEAVVERPARFVQTAADGGRPLVGPLLRGFDGRSEVSDLGRVFTETLAPVDGSLGLAIAAAGVPISRTRLVVDGLEEALTRHPGLPGLAPVVAAFPRGGVQQAGVLLSPHDVEWRSSAGGVLAVQTLAGSNETVVAPYLAASSGRIGSRPIDNPADSSAISLQGGLLLSGAIRRDTAHYLLRLDYQSIEQGSQSPWYNDVSLYRGAQVGLATTLSAIASDSFGRSIASLLAPPRRTWKGGSGLARVDWRFSDASRFTLRASFAAAKERAPTYGLEVAGSETSVASRDASVAAVLSTTAPKWANEARLGFFAARRDWRGSLDPTTSLVGDQIGFGTRPFAPALFDQSQLELTDAFQYFVGAHRLKVGGGLRVVRYEQRYRFGSTPWLRYGSLDDFARGIGAADQVAGAVEPVDFRITEPSIFFQDTWAATPELDLQFGVRVDAQTLPTNRITPNSEWVASSGLTGLLAPKGAGKLAPTASFVWNVRGAGQWIVRGGAGLHSDRLDPALFAEAIRPAGDVRVIHAVGDLGGWPAPSVLSSATNPTRLTLFAPGYRSPRTLKLDGGITRALGGGASLAITGYYGHTDYLLRRTDLNRVRTAVGQGVDGRPLYGALVKYGALVTGEPGSGRRFAAFDQVFGLAPTGFSDHYEVSAFLERRAAVRGVDLFASYTYSRTRDNTIGLLSADPADQLSPFPEGLSGADWTEGVSDLDVPHRIAGMAQLRTGGSVPVTLAVRGRWRSGLAYTAGLPRGVDLNADGSSNNDPAFLDTRIPGLAEGFAAGNCGPLTAGFAVRNGCREKAVGSLDLRIGLSLPGTGKRPLYLAIDAFNIASTTSGVVDRALLIPDPSRPLSTTSSGVGVPVVTNPRFGALLARRGEPRLIRASLRLEY